MPTQWFGTCSQKPRAWLHIHPAHPLTPHSLDPFQAELIASCPIRLGPRCALTALGSAASRLRKYVTGFQLDISYFSAPLSLSHKPNTAPRLVIQFNSLIPFQRVVLRARDVARKRGGKRNSNPTLSGFRREGKGVREGGSKVQFTKCYSWPPSSPGPGVP